MTKYIPENVISRALFNVLQTYFNNLLEIGIYYDINYK